jgi:HTH-type transcriptional regulator/antitoxin HigA
MNKRIRIIKNDSDYQEALELLEELMLKNPSPDTDEAEQLAVLAVIVENYESKKFPIDVPDAITAIEFRMDQLGLKPVDLVPYIGTASRVSEILAGKRNLTVEMINNLSNGLGIPAESLLQRQNKTVDSININSKAYKQMVERNYFVNQDTKQDKQSLLQAFFSGAVCEPALLRQSTYRASLTTDYYALVAWSKKVIHEAEVHPLNTEYVDGTVDLNYLKNITHLSIYPDGPLRAKEYLSQSGIKLIIEPHLEKTKFEGAVILVDKKHPIIGMTLRMDRLDNFWFTLLHELSHIALHYNSSEDIDFIYDELDRIKGEKLNDMELAADAMAGEALVPSDKWQVSPARLTPNPLAIESLAEELDIHPSIVAGKYRHENGEWSKLTQLVSLNKVREMFEDK